MEASTWGITINQIREVIVAEQRDGHCVSILSPSEEKRRTFGSRGSRSGRIQIRPCGVAVDDDDNILVVDGDNHRIQKFTSDGQFVKTVGSKGTGRLQFISPVGVAVHPHNKKVYVADCSNHRIQILNPDLTFSSSFGSRGSANGQFEYPWDVAFDNTGNLYVADNGNDCIKVFTAEGTFLRKFGQVYINDPIRPVAVAIDSDNTVYVTEYHNKRVSVFSSEGRFLKSFGAKVQFNDPQQITVDKSGMVYVSNRAGTITIY